MSPTMDNTSLRVWIYGRLAGIFDAELACNRGADPDHSPAMPALRTAIRRLARACDDVTPGELRTEHTRLFVNSEHTPIAAPYASVYLDGRLLGPSLDWVRREYAAQGLEPDADAGEPADYIAAELEFMYFLCRHELAARCTADAPALDAVLRAEARFVRLHLARWVPAFLARVRALAPPPVIDAAGALLAHLVQDDDHWLGAAVPVETHASACVARR